MVSLSNYQTMVLFSKEAEKFIVSLCGLQIPHKYSFSQTQSQSLSSVWAVFDHISFKFGPACLQAESFELHMISGQQDNLLFRLSLFQCKDKGFT